MRIPRLRLPKQHLLLEVTVVLAMATLLLSPAADLESGPGLQLLYSLRGVRAAPDDVVIVSLDSVSARDLGQSERPDRWSRRLHAQLVAALAARGARVIGFDMLFERARDPADDLALADALRQAGNVVLAERLIRTPIEGTEGRAIASIEQVTQPLPMIRDAAWATAPFVMPKTSDGVFEYWQVVTQAGDRVALPARMAERMRDGPGPTAEPAAADSRAGRRILNLYGPLGTVRTIRYADARSLAADPVAGSAAFGGKAVLIGHSEFNQSRQQDVFKTPFSSEDGVDLSGVELCATALANLIDGSSMRRPPQLLLMILLPLWSAILALPWGLGRPRIAALWMLGMCAAYGICAHLAFAGGLWLPVVMPLAVAPLLAAALGLSFQYGAVRRRQVQLETAIDLGLTRQSMERLSALLGGDLAGRTVMAACLCSDIEAYTSLSESLDPEATRDRLDRYFARFVPIIEDHGGYVTEIVADSVISLWVGGESAAAVGRQAQAAALALDQAMNQSDDVAALKTRFGLHYGPVYLGKVGTEQRNEIRAVGDTVNGSSRIQSANKYFGSRILASAAVAEAVPEAHWRCLGRFGLAGKAQTIELHQLTAMPLPADVTAAFAAGRIAFCGGDLALAAQHFSRVLAQVPDDGPARFYVERCREADKRTDVGADGSIVLPGK